MTALRIPRLAALTAIAALVAAATIAAIAESYRGLLLWAFHHGLAGIWAALFPLQVDTFLVIGELALFVALADGWSVRSRAGAWIVTLAGLAVSVAGNVGHVAVPGTSDRLTAAVPPLAAAAALAVGLGVLKRVVGNGASGHSAGTLVPEDDEIAGMFRAELEGGTVPGIRKIKRQARCGSPRATQIRDHLELVLAGQSANGNGLPG